MVVREWSYILVLSALLLIKNLQFFVTIKIQPSILVMKKVGLCNNQTSLVTYFSELVSHVIKFCWCSTKCPHF